MSEENEEALLYNSGSQIEQTCKDDKLGQIWFT